MTELTIDQALKKGVEAHKTGQVTEADRYYTAILKAQPQHPDANHNMGVLAVGLGKVQEALPFFKTALDANPSVAQFWLSYIDALIKLNQMDDAKAVLDEAKSKGVKGTGFEQIEKRIGSSDSKNSNVQEPPKEQLQNLINLYTQGQFQKALAQGSELLKDFPNSINLYYIIGASNKGLGKLDEAIEAYNKAISLKPDFAEAYYNMGNALQDQGKLDEAIEAYNKALSLKPDYPEAYNNKGIALQGQGKLEEAIKAYNKALSLKPNYAEACYNKGNALKDQGKLEEAIEAYNKALSLKPNYAEAYNNMGIALKDQGKLDEAIKVYNKTLSLKPDFAEAYYNMGNALRSQGKLDEAIEAYNKAISLKPDYAEAWLNGADALEKWNKLNELEIWLDNAFNSFETVPADLRFMKSKLLWRNKKFEETSYLISDIKFETISEIRKKDYLNLKAKCFEQSKKFEEAYECFVLVNSLVKISKEYKRYSPEDYFQNKKDNLAKIRSRSKKNVEVKSEENPEFLPTFLVGFPRSGTTLLDTILRSHSKIKVVEEKPLLYDTEKFLKKSGYDDFIDKFIPKYVNIEAQKIYKQEFNKHIDTSSIDKVYVDKLPLNLLKVPVIHQLYPDAKFILALRHPMDTILSCWMQNFKLNQAMANMVDLDRIVDFYCIAMETFKICRVNYNLNVYEIRYEDLIKNFQKESEDVVQFLNLQWEPEMANYQDTALKRGRINTPSYSQVVEPIYKDSQYRWLNYQKYLEQYLDQVKPWISEFGYD
ncbi:MAG: tetratricopeptide repeat-containing sulfotransferase family protein [Paracoccaceae bacterium]